MSKCIQVAWEDQPTRSVLKAASLELGRVFICDKLQTRGYFRNSSGKLVCQRFLDASAAKIWVEKGVGVQEF